jgi:hypothetical protein
MSDEKPGASGAFQIHQRQNLNAEDAEVRKGCRGKANARSFDSNPSTREQHARYGRNLAQDDVPESIGGFKEMGAIARALKVKIRSRGGCATQSKKNQSWTPSMNARSLRERDG